jgi:MFS family permease
MRQRTKSIPTRRQIIMNIQSSNSKSNDGYLFGPRQAWFAFAMTIGLMLFDYIDRQVIVSLFPYMKADWSLSDKQLGALVSALSIVLAACALPVSLVADRVSRVKSIVTMATLWSLASISCMFTRNYSGLLAARAMVGVGEAGYGAVGAALIATHFPDRMRSALLGSFMAAASVGSVLGVALGGVIAARWGWHAAFGVVGIPGLVLALLYIKVRDYHTVNVGTHAQGATRSAVGVARAAFGALKRSPTLLWVCIGSALQLIVLSAMWAWLPSFLNRVHGIAPEKAGMHAAIVVLCGAFGSVAWGVVCDMVGRRYPRGRVISMAVLCLISTAVLGAAFGLPLLGVQLSNQAQFVLVCRRRLLCDLHRRSFCCHRHECRPPGLSRHRRVDPRVAPEPARHGNGTAHRRRAVRRFRAADRIGRDAAVRHRCGLVAVDRLSYLPA